MNRNTLGLLFVLLAAPVFGDEPQAPGFTHVGYVHDPRITEVSGLAVSRQVADTFWVLNDSGNAPMLFAITPRGDTPAEVRAAVAIEGAANVDWEDLAAYEEDGQPWLAIADTGDNFRFQREARIHLLPEPALDTSSAKVARTIRFTYEDGAHDVEALAVDVPARRFLMLSKGEQPPTLYALGFDETVARRIAPLPGSAPGAPPLARTLGSLRYRGSPTAMSLSADGRVMLVLTGRHALRYTREGGEDWPQAFKARPPRHAALPNLSGWEAAGLSPDGKQAWMSVEGEWAHVYRWDY